MSDKTFGISETPVWIKPLTGTPVEICEAVRADLKRCQALVEEAVEVLSANLPLIASGEGEAGLNALSESIRSLQFSDMVRQLMESSETSLDRLMTFMSEARQTVPRRPASAGQDPSLSDWSNELSAFKEANCQPHEGPVDQEDLSEGDIELF
ncbi:MAG: hypothetical protein ACE366_27145 [Bradymonadia bacterium]